MKTTTMKPTLRKALSIIGCAALMLGAFVAWSCYLDILAAGLFFGALACGVIWNGEE